MHSEFHFHKETHKNRAVSGLKSDKKIALTMVVSQLYRYAYRAGPRTLETKAHQAPTRGAFSCLPFYYGGWCGQPSGWPVLGPVFATRTSPPPKPRTEVADSTTTKESEMSHDTHQGEIRPQSIPSLETISNVLATVDAVAALLETALTNPSTITPVWSRGLSATFKNLAAQIDGANLEGLDHE